MKVFIRGLFIVFLFCACDEKRSAQSGKLDQRPGPGSSTQLATRRPKSKPVVKQSPILEETDGRNDTMRKPQDSPNSQGQKTMKLTTIISGSASTGSIDPSSFAYGSARCYTPSDDESARLLDEIMVNGKVKLREFFEAVMRRDKAFLENLALKPKPQSKTDLRSPVGGSSSFWSIECGPYKIISADERFRISKFPGELLKDSKDIDFSYDMMGLYCHKVSSLGY